MVYFRPDKIIKMPSQAANTEKMFLLPILCYADFLSTAFSFSPPSLHPIPPFLLFIL